MTGQILEALTDYRAIALTIALLEGICLVFIRKAILFLEAGPRSQHLFAACCACLFLGLMWLFFLGEAMVFGPLLSAHGLPRGLYGVLLWDFFAALMVAFDCVLLYYALRVRSILKGRVGGSSSSWLLVLMLALVAGTYWVYYSHALELHRVGAVTPTGFLSLSDFFRRICSTYFVLLEATIAGLGLSIYGRVGRLSERFANG